MILAPTARSPRRLPWTLSGDAFVQRRLLEIVPPGELAGFSLSTATARLSLTATSLGIAGIQLHDGGPELPSAVRAEPGLLDLAQLVARCLERWEPGAQALPLDVSGTPFQLSCWAALREVPAGRTTTCGELARSLGLPASAARSIAGAVHANPVPVLIPAHRVIAGPGLRTPPGQRALLRAEGIFT